MQRTGAVVVAVFAAVVIAVVGVGTVGECGGRGGSARGDRLFADAVAAVAGVSK